MAILAAALVLVAATAVAQTAPSTSERDRLRADYERDLARLSQEHEKTVAGIRAEAAALEARVDSIRRLVPAQFEADFVEKRIQALARASELKPVEIRRMPASEKVVVPSGRATPYERFFMELSGQGSYLGLGFFLDRLSRLPSIVELETMSIEAAPRGSVRFAARLAFPCMTSTSPAATVPALPVRPPPIETLQRPPSERDVYESALAAHRAYFRRVQDDVREPIRRLQDEVAALGSLRNDRRPARFHAALSRFEAGMKDGRAVFSRARFGSQTVIEGAVSGEAARASLRPAFEAAGFAIESLDVGAAGGCRTFSLSARLKPAELPEDGVPDVEIGRTNRFRPGGCEPAAPPALGVIAARGTGGALTASLRGIDLPHAFQLLYTLGQGSYVVDADVKGRVDAELDRATLDEALAAIGSVGITVGPGPVRRVSRAGAKPSAPPQRPKSWEQKINLAFTNAVLLDVLRLFQEISGRKVWTAPTMDGRVTVFVEELPWDTALDAIAASAGMTAVIEGERIFVGPDAMAKAPWRSGAVEVTKAQTSDDEFGTWDRVGEIGMLTPEDLTPVGIAQSSEALQAVAYGPGRLLWVFGAGTRLSGARVEKVETTGVTFAAEDGRKSTLRFPAVR